jgi:hypothetical protein
MTDDLFPGALTYGFRKRRSDEDAHAYRKALIAHVEKQDYAAGFEIRINKPQALWTPEQIRAFDAHVRQSTPPSDQLRPGLLALHVVQDETRYPVTDDELKALAESALKSAMRMREQKPRKTLPIFLSVLLTDGILLTTATHREDRIAVLKFLAQTHPVFGFVCVFDAFLHALGETTATKKDCLMAQIGTRDWRLLKHRPYVVRGNIAIWDWPYPADVDVSAEMRKPGDVHDPYATIFVSVPPSSGAPS